MSKSLVQAVFLIVLIASPIQCRKIDILTTHEMNIGDMKINQLLQRIIPRIDISRPLYEFGALVGRGGRVISPGLHKAGQVSTAVGVVFVNVGTLLLTLSQLLSSQGAIGGNPNFLNDALNEYLVKANIHVKPQVAQTTPLAEVASSINSNPNAQANTNDEASANTQIQQGGPEPSQYNQKSEPKSGEQNGKQNQQQPAQEFQDPIIKQPSLIPQRSPNSGSSSTQKGQRQQKNRAGRTIARERWVDDVVEPIWKEPEIIKNKN